MVDEPGGGGDGAIGWSRLRAALAAVPGEGAAERRACRANLIDRALAGLAREAGLGGAGLGGPGVAGAGLVGPEVGGPGVAGAGLGGAALGGAGSYGAGLALAAVGSYGRREPSPHSDLDLMLLHSADGAGGVAEAVAQVAERLWYPIWDSGIALDHAVHSLDGARDLARRDLPTLAGMLELRHVAGDPGVTRQLSRLVLADWRADAPTRLPELRELCRVRAARSGELAFASVPDLKDSRGGLRDLAVMRAVAASWTADFPRRGLGEARRELLDIRDALRHLAGRAVDRIQVQDQDPLSGALGLADRDELMQRVAGLGRAVAHALDITWYAVERAGRAPTGPRPARRTPLADGVVRQDGEARLARGADLADPTLPLRLAAAAAHAGIPMSPAALAAAVRAAAPMPVPWPEPARRALLTLLGAGEPLVDVWEALDQAGVITGALPGWARLRSLPQRDPVHRYTVDRHLVRTAVEAARLVRRLARPDLLLLAALLHDIGKGVGSDHSDAGAAIAPGWLARMGVPAPESAAVVWLVRHHLLLAETAARRDPDDPATVALLAARVGTAQRLDLLLALTQADALAAGPRAWTPWKAAQVAGLASRARLALEGAQPGGAGPGGAGPGGAGPGGGGPGGEGGHASGGGGGHASGATATRADSTPPAQVDAPTVSVRACAGCVEARVLAVDRPGLMATVAAVLERHGLSVRSATARTDGPVAAQLWEAEPRFGDGPDPAALRSALLRALDGHHAAAPRPDRPMSPMSPMSPTAAAPPVVQLLPGQARNSTVLQVRAPDLPGLLAAVTAAIGSTGTGIAAARADTYGSDAVDVFYLRRSDRPLTPAQEREVVAAVTRRLAAPAPADPRLR